MSFLSQLKAQANVVQAANAEAQTQAQIEADGRIDRTEAACKIAWNYLGEMARQLNILTPQGPVFSVDGKTPWPVMKLVDFRTDSRKKILRNREIFSSIGVGWDIVPQQGKPVQINISVNFLPELQKVESRLSAGGILHERFQVRHPEKQSVQAIAFQFHTQARGSIHVTPDHEQGTLAFRFFNISGLAVQTGVWAAELVQVPFLDELAKLVLSQPSHFFPISE